MRMKAREKHRQQETQKQEFKQLERLELLEEFWEDECLEEMDEEVLEEDIGRDERILIDNVTRDFSLILPPGRRVAFFVFGRRVITGIASAGGREFARALEEALADISEIDKNSIYRLKSVFKGRASGWNVQGQRWAKGYVYFHDISLLVPVSFFVGGVGKTAKKRVEKKVLELLRRHKDEILENADGECEDIDVVISSIEVVLPDEWDWIFRSLSDEEVMRLWQKVCAEKVE